MSKPIKPRRMWTHREGLGPQSAYARKTAQYSIPVLVIDLSPENVEALRATVRRKFAGRPYPVEVGEVLAAIGIKARGRK